MNIPENFGILYEDEHLVAINKPPGILVHRTRISEDVISVLPLLRDQIGKRVYPAHRLDRGTSGVLLFGKNKEAASFLGRQFRERSVEKEYQAVIRGYVDEQGQINYPLAGDGKKEAQEAITDYWKISQSEKHFAISRYPTSRYSLVRIVPQTGRFHQIRRHFAHVRHPVIGDKRHGDCKHNKFFREELEVDRMLLHASRLSFTDLYGVKIMVAAPREALFSRAVGLLGLEKEKSETDGGSTSD